MTPDQIEKSRERSRRYRRAHPEVGRAWALANREKMRAIEAAYRKRHPKRVKKASKRRYSRRREQAIAYVKKWRAEHPGAESARRRAVKGRVCISCERSDAEAYWSLRRDTCSACAARGRKNGFCEPCGAALYATRPHDCPMKGSGAGELPERLWDAIRDRDELAFPLIKLADLMGLCRRTLKRQGENLLAIVQEFDPGARIARDKTAHGAPVSIFMDTPSVRRGLDRLVNGESAA